jgi:LAO/AO transport system kinase
MSKGPRNPRREMSRALSRVANATVAETLETQAELPEQVLYRIGVTGAPGAGKSTLISRLAARRVARDAKVAVVAIDPTSPVSQGSILGDRIRMDAVSDDPNIFIRSIPSRRAHDGLADNTADLLWAMEGHGFDEVIVETVGVGQAEYSVRAIVDTVVLVLLPESGDAVQAMKAGAETGGCRRYCRPRAGMPRVSPRWTRLSRRIAPGGGAASILTRCAARAAATRCRD